MKTGLGLLLLLLAAGCASAPVGGGRGGTVEAEGRAPEGPGAGERALVDALKRAVEGALGVSLAASTRVEGAIAVRRRIWADARGKVERWTVLRETTEAGMRVVWIRAVVRRASATEVLPPPAESTVRIAAQGPAAEGLRRSFGAGGFKVVEGGGDFVATVRANSNLLRDPRTAPFVTSRARVRVAVVESATGTVVSERAGEAAGLDADALDAAAKAGDAAGELAGTAAAVELSSYLWKQ